MLTDHGYEPPGRSCACASGRVGTRIAYLFVFAWFLVDVAHEYPAGSLFWTG